MRASLVIHLTDFIYHISHPLGIDVLVNVSSSSAGSFANWVPFSPFASVSAGGNCFFSERRSLRWLSFSDNRSALRAVPSLPANLFSTTKHRFLGSLTPLGLDVRVKLWYLRSIQLFSDLLCNNRCIPLFVAAFHCGVLPFDFPI